MTVIDKIHQRVRILPEPLQAEVLDFVEFLLSKKTIKLSDDAQDFDDLEWSNLSLTMAMRDMENEEEPYTIADLKETF
ncbi:MAG TPA: DUF2281 domain-containing protein [Anaerolineae bacterium]|nr:DUF2281 domain-containing protein [Anaerolineae bacterium]